MEDNQVAEIIYQISTEDVQNEANRIIGRELTDEEMHYAIKGIEAGISCVMDITMKTAIEEAVDKFASP